MSKIKAKSAFRAKQSKPKKTASQSKPTRVMVLYGFDEREQPRAALFAEPNFELARKAAKMIGLQVHVGDTKKLKPVLEGIKLGRIYASGTGVVPNITSDRFERLIADLGVKQPAPAKVPPLRLPISWAAIAVGDTVLAQADSAANGWWRATVENITAEMLLLRSRDFPEITVRRHRNAVALLHTTEYAAPNIPADEIAPELPKGWDSLAARHLVLAEEGPGEGHFEAIIDAVSNHELTLHWRDYKHPGFKRSRETVALLNPAAPK